MRLLFLAVAALTLSPSVHAQAVTAATPSSEAVTAANELVALLDLRAAMRQALEPLAPMVADVVIAELQRGAGTGHPFARELQTEAGRAAFRDEFAREFSDGMMARMGALSRIMAESYARGMSLEELRAATAFLRTPAGRNLIKVQNSANEVLDQFAERMGEEIGEQVVRAMILRQGKSPTS